jgi:hypothetical protein
MDSHSSHVVDTDRNQPPSVQPVEYRAYHSPDSPAKLTTTVVHALADAMGVDVTEIGFSLYDSIDPDALNMIFAPKPDGSLRSPGHVAFSVKGYLVTVYSGGQIVITAPDAPPR